MDLLACSDSELISESIIIFYAFLMTLSMGDQPIAASLHIRRNTNRKILTYDIRALETIVRDIEVTLPV
jgi:hypothetical protein